MDIRKAISDGLSNIGQAIGNIPKNVEGYVGGRSALKADQTMYLIPAPPIKPKVTIGENGVKTQQKLTNPEKILNGVYGVTAAPLLFIGYASVAAYKNSLMKTLDKNADKIQELNPKIETLQQRITTRAAGMRVLSEERNDGALIQGARNQITDMGTKRKLEKEEKKLQASSKSAERQLNKLHQTGRLIRGEGAELPAVEGSKRSEIETYDRAPISEKTTALMTDLREINTAITQLQSEIDAKIKESSSYGNHFSFSGGEIIPNANNKPLNNTEKSLLTDIEILMNEKDEALLIKEKINLQIYVEDRKENLTMFNDRLNAEKEKINAEPDVALKKGLEKDLEKLKSYEQMIPVIENSISGIETKINELENKVVELHTKIQNKITIKESVIENVSKNVFRQQLQEELEDEIEDIQASIDRMTRSLNAEPTQTTGSYSNYLDESYKASLPEQINRLEVQKTELRKQLEDL